MKKKRISLYVDEELYDRFMSYMRVTDGTASDSFEKKMRDWLEINEVHIKEKLSKGYHEYPKGMS